MKVLLNVIGCIALALGVLGIFLPLLPTTPFLLLASACFARGSDRLHRWLLTHGVFGEYLRNFEEGKGIPLRAKRIITAMMWLSLLYSMYRFDSIALRVGLGLIGLSVTLYLWTRVPSTPIALK